MAKQTPEQGVEYIVDIPTHPPVSGVTTATNPDIALRNILFRSLRDRSKAARIYNTIKKSRAGIARYVQEVPVVFSDEPLSREEREESEEYHLAAQIAEVRGGAEVEHLPYARNLMEMYRRTKRPETH